jgi:hypothetical protein
LNELSLFFRWFYLEASARIFAGNPLVGVGPAGYQTAYARAKNPLSPEEVVSPHSIAADFACTLGIAGLAWLALIAWWVHRSGPGLLASPGDPPRAADPGPVTRPRIYAMAAVVAGATILPQVLAPGGTLAISIAATLSNADPVPFSALAAGLGAEAALAGLWIIAAIAIGRCVRAAPGAGAAGAVVLWIHAQIEMTPVQPGSAPLFAILLAALVSPTKPRALPGRIRRELTAIAPWVAVAAVLNSTDRMQLRDLWLVRAMRATEPAASLIRDYRDIERASLAPRDRQRRLEELDARMAEYVRTASPFARLMTFEDRLVAVRGLALSEGLPDLWQAALAAENGDPVTNALYVRRLLQAHVDDPALGGRATPRYGLLFPFVRSALKQRPGDAAMWMLYGDALDLARAQGLPPPEPRDSEAPDPTPAGAWHQAHELDPHSPAPVDRLLDEALRSGDPAEAGRWADVRLELDENARLDRTRRLSDRERAWLVGIAGGRDMGPRPGVRSAGSPPPGS